MEDFVFVRHGQSQANADRYVATGDSPLTGLGREQARQTAEKVSDLGIEVVASSPCLRARQTAEIIAGQLGIGAADIVVLDSLRERGLGEFEGRPKTRESGYFFTVDREMGVEPKAEVLERMRACLNEIRELSRLGKVLAVGHAVSGYFLIEASKGRELGELDPPSQMSNADYVVIALDRS